MNLAPGLQHVAGWLPSRSRAGPNPSRHSPSHSPSFHVNRAFSRLWSPCLRNRKTYYFAIEPQYSVTCSYFRGDRNAFTDRVSFPESGSWGGKESSCNVAPVFAQLK
jgi:hypothetical protein